MNQYHKKFKTYTRLGVEPNVEVDPIPNPTSTGVCEFIEPECKGGDPRHLSVRNSNRFRARVREVCQEHKITFGQVGLAMGSRSSNPASAVSLIMNDQTVTISRRRAVRVGIAVSSLVIERSSK